MSAQVEIEGLVKAYGATRAVDGVSLSVERGELVALLGPSGCGKTTTLRAVAGFVEPTEGRVSLAGRDVTRVPPHKRDTGMVFQSYALFPHLTVARNIGFGLARRGVPREEARKRVGEMMERLELSALADRLPRQLSGGQQQRVAVGRALVINPAVLLLDEPFSNLDALLRETTRLEMRRLQRSLGITTILVTHDQEEAMAIADRIAIMHQGRIEQTDAPASLYARPATRFVAGFVGHANLFEGRVTGRDGEGVTVESDGLTFRLPPGPVPDRCCLMLRPEAIVLGEAGAVPAVNGCAATVDMVSFLGSTAHVSLTAGSRRLIAEGPGTVAARLAPGTAVTATWPAESLVVVPG